MSHKLLVQDETTSKIHADMVTILGDADSLLLLMMKIGFKETAKRQH